MAEPNGARGSLSSAIMPQLSLLNDAAAQKVADFLPDAAAAAAAQAGAAKAKAQVCCCLLLAAAAGGACGQR